MRDEAPDGLDMECLATQNEKEEQERLATDLKGTDGEVSYDAIGIALTYLTYQGKIESASNA